MGKPRQGQKTGPETAISASNINTLAHTCRGNGGGAALDLTNPGTLTVKPAGGEKTWQYNGLGRYCGT